MDDIIDMHDGITFDGDGKQAFPFLFVVGRLCPAWSGATDGTHGDGIDGQTFA